jgi:hypothetical protein
MKQLFLIFRGKVTDDRDNRDLVAMFDDAQKASDWYIHVSYVKGYYVEVWEKYLDTGGYSLKFRGELFSKKGSKFLR